MCGRFAQISPVKVIKKEFNVKEIAVDFKPNYNAAPTQNIAAIIYDKVNKLVQLRWGLIPFWAKEASIGNKMINARAETITDKPSFRNAFQRHRCLIAVDGFYEWKKEGGIRKPLFIFLKSKKPFGLAALYETWTSPEGVQIMSCSIITTEANALMKSIHTRMPVIIPKDHEAQWLDFTGKDRTMLLQLLKPYDSEQMDSFYVSQFVNSPKNNSPECIKPLYQTMQ